MNPLTRYFIHQAGGGGGGSGGGVGPLYSVPAFVQAVYWADYFGRLDLSFFRVTHRWQSVGREALRTGGKILTDIADNPQTGIKQIISKHMHSTVQILGTKMTCRDSKRKRRSTSRVARKSKRPNRTTKRTSKKTKKSTRKRSVTRRRNTPLAATKRDIFS